MSAKKLGRGWSRACRNAMFLVAIVIGAGSEGVAQAVLDICGCAGDPTLQPFDAANPATYPPGTTGCTTPCTSGTIIFPLPPDGVLKFSSFTANSSSNNFHLRFTRNAANTPVTILVAGDVLLRNGSFCCGTLNVSGGEGSTGSSSTAGVGGDPGHAGFRGGDGSALAINGFDVGGSGFGPGGGQAAAGTANAAGGTFFGTMELLPLVGGSGGGGGSGFGASTSCTGGGGGAGGGAVLIAANGTITLTNFDIQAKGGSGGTTGNSGCARGGAGGSGGAIRLIASRFAGGTSGFVTATGGPGSGHGGANGSDGRIRLESIDTSAQTEFATSPAALRVTGPGPLSNPVAPRVNITHVNGSPVPDPPQGFRGSIDLVLPAPGVTSVNIATSGVPSGTTIEVKARPRVGANPLTSTVPLTAGDCDAQGNCTATTTFNLNAGAYVLEARATFQVQ